MHGLSVSVVLTSYSVKLTSFVQNPQVRDEGRDPQTPHPTQRRHRYRPIFVVVVRSNLHQNGDNSERRLFSGVGWIRWLDQSHSDRNHSSVQCLDVVGSYHVPLIITVGEQQQFYALYRRSTTDTVKFISLTELGVAPISVLTVNPLLHAVFYCKASN